MGLLLRDALGVFDDTQLARSAFGKIELADGEAPSISISHGGSVAVLAVSDVARSGGGPIGVDIEAIDEIAPVAVERMVNDDERAWINAAPNLQERNLRLSQTWTCIEAILKAEGVGFSIDPRKDGMPDGWNTSSVTYGRCVISCAARSMPRIVLKEHTFRVA
ncbi:MAG: 4'-phosphopantetheinyl transferase superfamily protein [Collinsella sp.]|nr:4'-phosphopantetheinyl transferase superfamily protein [Collinsella sp.]